MKTLLTISLKNVLKSRERVILTFLILSFGAFSYVFLGSMMNALLNMTNNDVKIEETADIRVRALNYDEDNPLSQTNLLLMDSSILTNYNSTPRLIISAEADNYENVLPIQFFGVDTTLDTNVFTVHYTSEEPLEEGVVYVGSLLARDMDLGIGDYINITFRTLDNEGIQATRSSSYYIGGLLTSSISTFTEQVVMTDINDLWTQLGTNVVSYYSVKLANPNTLNTELTTLQALLPSNEVVSWEYLTREARESISMRQAFLNVFLVLIVFITLIGLMNTILISVWEKRKTTGTLRALGYKDNQLVFLFILEGFWIGLIGSILGVFLGVLANIPLSTLGFNFSAMLTIDGQKLDIGMQIPPILRSTWDLSTFLLPILFMPIAAMLVSLFPAKKSVSMSITDCLRNKD